MKMMDFFLERTCVAGPKEDFLSYNMRVGGFPWFIWWAEVFGFRVFNLLVLALLKYVISADLENTEVYKVLT